MKIREVSEQQINAALQEIENKIAEIIKRQEKMEAANSN